MPAGKDSSSRRREWFRRRAMLRAIGLMALPLAPAAVATAGTRDPGPSGLPFAPDRFRGRIFHLDAPMVLENCPALRIERCTFLARGLPAGQPMVVVGKGCAGLAFVDCTFGGQGAERICVMFHGS